MSHRLRYYGYFILRYVQPKGAVALSYGDSLTAMIVTRADWEAAKVVETSEQNGDEVEIIHCVHVPEVQNYFISSEISDEWVKIAFSVI